MSGATCAELTSRRRIALPARPVRHARTIGDRQALMNAIIMGQYVFVRRRQHLLHRSTGNVK